MPEETTSLSLACPYCGSGLWINQETEGRPYLTYEVPESIECAASDCGAVWEPDGTHRDDPQWIRFPTLYEVPERVTERARADATGRS